MKKIKKVKDTILKYLHIGIYVKISASYVKRWISVDRQTNTHIHKKDTHWVKTEEIFFTAMLFIF